MASTSLLAKLLLFITLVTTLEISKANEELMMQQCHNSENPTLCLRCLNSDPTSSESDQIGLARIILKCIDTHLVTLTKNASSLASKHQKSPKAVAAFKKCGLGYATAKRGIGEADAHLITGEFDKAAFDVSKKVVVPPVLCRDNLMTVKIHMPGSFRYYTEVYLELTQALLRIIDRF